MGVSKTRWKYAKAWNSCYPDPKDRILSILGSISSFFETLLGSVPNWRWWRNMTKVLILSPPLGVLTTLLWQYLHISFSGYEHMSNQINWSEYQPLLKTAIMQEEKTTSSIMLILCTQGSPIMVLLKRYHLLNDKTVRRFLFKHCGLYGKFSFCLLHLGVY